MLSEKLVDINTHLQSDSAPYVQYSTNSKYYSGSSIEGYVTNYVNKLNALYNISATGTLIDKWTCDELGRQGGNNMSNCPKWVNNYAYWTRSNFVASYGDSVGVVYYNQYLELDYTSYFGLRPIITINSSLLDNCKIIADNT